MVRFEVPSTETVDVWCLVLFEWKRVGTYFASGSSKYILFDLQFHMEMDTCRFDGLSCAAVERCIIEWLTSLQYQMIKPTGRMMFDRFIIIIRAHFNFILIHHKRDAVYKYGSLFCRWA